MTNRQRFIYDYMDVCKAGVIQSGAVIEDVYQQLDASGSDTYELSASESLSGNPELFSFERSGDDLIYMGRC